MTNEELIASVLQAYRQLKGIENESSTLDAVPNTAVVPYSSNDCIAGNVQVEAEMSDISTTDMHDIEMEEEEKYTKPRLIQVFKKTKNHVNHSYRDFSSVPPEDDYVETTDLNEMSFVQKLHYFLSNPEYSHVICWMPHGRSFKVINQDELEKSGLLRDFFGLRSLSSFKREIFSSGFKTITKGLDKKCYYHEVSIALPIFVLAFFVFHLILSGFYPLILWYSAF
jgi:hypothetical protein